MSRMRVVLSVVVLALAAATLPGCPAFTGIMKTVGVIGPPELDLSGPVPQDFELRVHATDQASPAVDYLLVYRRSGRCDYHVTFRTGKRRAVDGTFDILEGQVVALYEMARSIGYASIDERIPAEGQGPDTALGVQAYSVAANNMAREVQVHMTTVPELEQLRKLALSYVPPKALADVGAGPPVAGTSRQIIGDLQTKIFYPADDPRLKDVPADRRQPFPTWEDALNFGYAPASGFQPWARKE